MRWGVGDLDVPVTVALAEVKVVTVDVAAPLFGCPAAVAVDDHTRVLGQPGLEGGFCGLLGVAGLLALW